MTKKILKFPNSICISKMCWHICKLKSHFCNFFFLKKWGTWKMMALWHGEKQKTLTQQLIILPRVKDRNRRGKKWYEISSLKCFFQILSFCFQRFREGCRKRQFFFEMSPLLINCVSEVLSCQRVYSGEVFKILLLLQIKPGKCTEMYLKFLSTDVKAE